MLRRRGWRIQRNITARECENQEKEGKNKAAGHIFSVIKINRTPRARCFARKLPGTSSVEMGDEGISHEETLLALGVGSLTQLGNYTFNITCIKPFALLLLTANGLKEDSVFIIANISCG